MAEEEQVAESGAGSDDTPESSQVEEGQDLEIEEEREPGGDSPEQIRARKEYRLRKKTEAALQAEREKAIALEARVNTLAEVANRETKPPVKEQQRLSTDEAWAKVDTGEWTRGQASEYIADTRYQEHRAKEKADERAVKEIVEPFERAKKEAFEYIALVPGLKDHTHPKWKAIEAEVGRLINEDGVRTLIQAERSAMRTVLGPIEQIREKQKMEAIRAGGDAHTETRGAAGGGGSPAANKKDPFPDIPQFTKDLWERTNTSQKDREIEAKYYRDTKAKR